jgi:tetratricopeptide (TPR) repeat protein
MLSRLFTWAFYAVVFFLLGAWIGGFSPGLRALMRDGGQAAVATYEKVQQWAVGTITDRPTPEPSAVKPSPADLLRSARAAFERGEVNESIALYRERLRDDPDDLDARGELGNALSNAGRLTEATETYYEVAVRLARAGDTARARALEAAIRRDNAALADKLSARLKAGKSGG